MALGQLRGPHAGRAACRARRRRCAISRRSASISGRPAARARARSPPGWRPSCATSRRPGATMLIVTHKGVLRASLVLALGWDMLGKPPVATSPTARWFTSWSPRGRPTFVAACRCARQRVSRGWRCLFWVQSLLGTGHLRRALAAGRRARGARRRRDPGQRRPAGAMARARPACELVQLPPVTASGVDFGELVDASGDASVTAALWARAAAPVVELARAGRGRRPCVTEMFPFGRRAFRGELLPLLEAARALRPRPLVARQRARRAGQQDRPDALRLDGRRLPRALRPRAGARRRAADRRSRPPSRPRPSSATASSIPASCSPARPCRRRMPRRRPPCWSAPAAVRSASGCCERRSRHGPLTRFASAPWLLVGGQNLPAEALAGLAARRCPKAARSRATGPTSRA